MSESRNDLTGWGPVYWGPFSYWLTMAILRPMGRSEMFNAVVHEIGHTSVLELCCGSGALARKINKSKYTGIDANPIFVDSLNRKGFNVTHGNVLEMKWPAADTCVMVESLYHFLPDPSAIIEKMMAGSFRKVIISESIENVSHSRHTAVRKFTAWATRIDGKLFPHRYNEDSLREFFRSKNFRRVARVGSNLIGVYERP